MTGARVGNINGGRARSNDGSSGRGSPFIAGAGGPGLNAMAPPFQQQTQQYRTTAQNGRSILNGCRLSFTPRCY